jgi:hypothetical protein
VNSHNKPREGEDTEMYRAFGRSGSAIKQRKEAASEEMQ